MASRRRGDPILIAALARGLTQKQAAAEAGVSERTVRRRLEDMEFRMAVFDEQRAIASEANAQLIGMLPKAVATLDEVLEHAKPETRIRAAKVVLDAGAKAADRAERVGDALFMFLTGEWTDADFVRDPDSPQPPSGGA